MKKLFLAVMFILNYTVYSQNIEEIKKAETVYVYFKYRKSEQHHNKEKWTKTNQNYDNYYYIFSYDPNYLSINFSHFPLSTPEERIEKKSFIKKNKDLIITYEFLTQFNLAEATELLRDKKKVYLIDKKDFCWGKIILKEVDVLGTFPQHNE